jgi:hypothetical protein
MIPTSGGDWLLVAHQAIPLNSAEAQRRVATYRADKFTRSLDRYQWRMATRVGDFKDMLLA